MLSQQRSFLPGSGNSSHYTSRPQSYKSGYRSMYGSRAPRGATAPVQAPAASLTVQVQPVVERPMVTSAPVLA